MSKVLVDRELLERIDRCYMDGMSIYGECEEIRAILAQPAGAEGVERWSELQQLAEKATPGPWWVDSHGHRVSTEDGMQTVFITADKMGPATRHPETGNLSHWPNDWDASYIVNASPDKILELLTALSAVTAERDRLLVDLERAHRATNSECQDWAREYERRKEVQAERDQLRAEVEALRKDAERYRWLRYADLDALAEANWGLEGEVYQGDEFDRAIDAAMAAKEA